MNIRYRVELSQTERADLTALLAGGKHAARKLKRAQILLAADAGVDDETIATSVVGGSTVYRTKRRFVEGDLEAALNEEPRPGGERKLTGKQEALLVATACSAPPKGRNRWTLELLAGEMVKLTEHDGLSRETIRRRFAENDLKPWRRDMWCIPEVDGEYVARMEDVLDLYAEGMIQSDPSYALMKVRISSSARFASQFRPSRASWNAMIANTGAMGRSISSSSSTRIDPGAGSRSQNDAPLRILPQLHARSRRSPLPSGRCRPGRSGQSVDPFSGRALRSLSGAGSPPHLAPPGIPLHAQARQLAQHGRNRNRRLARPVPRPSHRQKDRLVAEIAAWEEQRNEAGARINWMFTTDRARTKLARAYPDTTKES